MKQWAKRVVLFGVDGAGTFFEQTPTPNIDRIFRNGAVCRRALTELPSISGASSPSGTIVTSSIPSPHKEASTCSIVIIRYVPNVRMVPRPSPVCPAF